MARVRADRTRRVPAAHVAGAGIVALALVAARPAPAIAQTSAALAGHVSRAGAFDAGPMVGMAAEVGQGPLAFRLSGAVDAAGTPFASMLAAGDATTTGAWNADLDAGLDLGRVPVLDRLIGRWHPTPFVGLGVAAVQGADDDRSSVAPTWSWGARAGIPLLSWLSIEGEARHRDVIGPSDPALYSANGDWEYRVGLALRFGGSAPRVSASRAPTSRRGGATTRPVRTTRVDDARRAASAAEIADRAIDFGERYIGTPYVWGGQSPSGFDCSGFVQYVYRRHGIELPRVSRDQARAGVSLPTSLSGIARGDLLFFAGDGRTVSHVAIYAGDGRILHSSSSGRGVRYDDLRGSRGGWYVNHLVAVRRVIDDGTLLWPDTYAGADIDADMPGRALPLDQAFDALVGDSGDVDAPRN